MKEFSGRIKWIEVEKGGRKNNPDGTAEKYARMMRCPDLRIWSVIIYPIDPVDYLHVRFHFLVEDAPTHLIISGETYTVTEGTRDVAYITVD